MDLFTYLMAKKGHNTGRDLFSYLLGKNAGGSGTYTTFSGITLNISNTLFGKIKNFMLNSTELTQDGTPSPDNPVDVNVIKGNNNVKVENKNVLNATWEQGTFDYTNNINYDDTNRIRSSKFAIKPSTQYTFSCNDGLGEIGYIFYQENGTTYIAGSATATNDTYATITTPSNAYYMRIRIGSRTLPKTSTTNYQQQLEIGSTATEYVEHQEQNYPISLGNLEYCKIGDYKDQIFKNTTDSPYYDNTLIENEWYLKKMVGKIDSYNGETITTPYISTTGGLDNGATIYYGLSTPTYIHITPTDYPTLKAQLEDIYNNSKSYNGQTNITQTNDDLPFNISVDVLVGENNG